MQNVNAMTDRKKSAIISSYARNLPQGKHYIKNDGSVWISHVYVGRVETYRTEFKISDSIDGAVIKLRPSAA